MEIKSLKVLSNLLQAWDGDLSYESFEVWLIQQGARVEWSDIKEKFVLPSGFAPGLDKIIVDDPHQATVFMLKWM